MTELQISLLVAGGTLVVAVFAYNKWLEYKARRRIDQAFSDGHEDVLMQPAQQEPSHAGHPAAIPTRHEPGLDKVEPSLTEYETEQRDAGLSEGNTAAIDDLPHPVKKDLPVDELIDCIIALELEAPLRGEKILAEINELRYAGKKPVHFIGLTDGGQQDSIMHHGHYSTVFAGIQMVNRSGPLNEVEFSEFIAKLRPIADRLNAHPDIPDMNKVMEQARELHQFASEHDAQLSVNVAANGAPWAINTLLGSLEKQGFDVRPDSRLIMPDGDGGILFSLTTNTRLSEEVTSRLTLLLDVPCVTPARDGFGAMAACARSLAIRLGGTVVDDGNQPISKPALEEIAGQVSEFYAAMAEAQIPAGSVRAQRLFS